jgi:alpha-L-fucosidase
MKSKLLQKASPFRGTMKKKNGLKKLILPAICALATVVQAETAAEHGARLAWWRDARFGMFIHWGPVSLTGQEISWSRANSNTNCPNDGPIPVAVYDNLYKGFNPTNFNAREWVGDAKNAGMKYMVLTAKHGDGFLLWDSQVDGYNIGATPFHRDVCAELAEAAHQQGEKIGWYFSEMDWRDPDCRSTNNDRFVKKFQAELRELLSHYGRIAVLWFDSDGRPDMWDPTNTYALVHKLQPQILINNRLQMGTQEQWLHQGQLLPNEDYYTPEQRIGAYDAQTPWETCMTLGTQWSWKPDDKIKSAGEVIRILAQCAGGDGNLLLDVGPMPDGRIEPRQAEVLKQVGAWLDKNGESIYSTRGGPWKPTKAIASTRKGKTIYLHILRGQSDTIELPDIARTIKSASLPGGGRVRFAQRDGKLILTVPVASRNAGDTVIKLKLDGSAVDLPAMEIPQIETVKATASNIFENDNSNYGPLRAFDEDEQTRWATDNGTKQAWIAADFLKPQTVSRVHVSEAYPDRIQKFEFQYRDGNDWKTIFTGTTLGDNFEKSFSPVTAREFRLNILDATVGPTISEIKLLP